jgi:hypothetical protein
MVPVRRKVSDSDPSYAGLTRVSIHLRLNLAKKMDGRVKPGHDEVVVTPRFQRDILQLRSARGVG